ncbi:MAG: hypothetical protein U9O06_05580 [Euryarchaeota archaeon]|nr:hypothetical protein [Euryarchaeota archaeon]
MSTDLSDAVLEEAASRGETLTIHDLLRLIERFDTGPGIPDTRLDRYLDALGNSRFNESALREGLDRRLVDAADWETETEVYRLDGGVSAFPPRWHDDLTGETDLTRYVATMTTAVEGGSEGYAHGGHGDGVPEKLLLDTAVIFGDYNYKRAMDEVDRLRDGGLLDAGADQHPNARLRLTPEAAEHLGIDPEADDVAVKTGTDRTDDPRIDE